MKKNVKMPARLVVLAVTLLAASGWLTPTPAFATVTLTNATNLTLVNQETTAVTDGPMPYPYGTSATGGLLTYTATANPAFLNATYGAAQLNNGDVGPASTGTTTYAIVNSASGSLTLTLTATQAIGSIAIYDGYTNRDDGTYTLTNAAGVTLGGYSIVTPVGSTNNAGTDDFYLKFNTPVTTSALTITYTSTDTSPSASFREIQVFGVPEPHTLATVLGGLALLVLVQRRARCA